MKTSIALFDDNIHHAHALKRFLSDFPDLQFKFKAQTKSLLFESAHLLPQVLIVRYPFIHTESEGVIEEIKKLKPDLRIIVLLSVRCDDDTVLNLMDEGANAILDGTGSLEEILTAINTVLETKYFYNRCLSESLLHEVQRTKRFQKNARGFSGFKKLEVEILQEVAEGRSHLEIAEKRDLALHTIDTYISRMIVRLDKRNVMGVIHFALKNKIIKI